MNEISEIKAGPELDVAIVSRVFGENIRSGGKIVPLDNGYATWVNSTLEHLYVVPLPPYSANIDLAWKVVEKMREKYHFTLSDDTNSEIGTHWLAHFYNNRVTPFISSDSFSSRSETAPLAICRAALLAVSNGNTL